MTTMSNTLFQIKTKLFLLFVLSFFFISSLNAFGYVIPAEQILDFMIKNFSGFRTVTLVQSTLQTSGGYEKVFTEQLWQESPDKYSTKALDRLAERDVIAPDLIYRQLFVANSREKIERILLPLGINLAKTSYTRFNGVIAYRIGDKEPDSPMLIIEKKRFLPLMLIYRIPDSPESELITVKFEDYRKENKGWYPFEITYKQGERLTEEYKIQTFQTNIPVDASILNTFPEYELPEAPESELEPATVDSEVDPENESETTDIDKERLRNVIKAFEEEYQ
ncbi:MAG: hypothetical protein PVG39_16720 [Desulfobacteraceae bacterium]|jgi:hypothetical protein